MILGRGTSVKASVHLAGRTRARRLAGLGQREANHGDLWKSELGDWTLIQVYGEPWEESEQ